MFLSDDDMVECPYNKSHRMLRKRLQSHLLKCRLSFPEVELRKCPFNITHLVPEPEFTHHATSCPDRKLITQYKYDAPEVKEDEGPKHAPIECDEDWDDTDVNDYNPKQYVENANVIRKPEGCNPSIRKVFIKQERKRLGDGDEEDEEEDTKNGIPLMGNRENASDEEDEHARPRVDKSLKNNYKYDTTTVHSSRADWHGGSSSSSTSHAGGSRRNKRSESPSTSSSKRHSRSPTSNRSKRDRSRSPGDRSYRERSPLRRSPLYSRRYSPPRTSVSRTYNPDKDPYYNSGGSAGSTTNSSRAYYDRSSVSSTAQPQAPPPPMISYPAPRSYRK